MPLIPVTPRTREISKRTFGQELRLSVMLFIGRHGDDLFCLTDVARALEVRHGSSVQEPLHSLVELGLVVRQPSQPGDKHRWYKRTQSHGWDFAEELLKLAQGGMPSRDGDRRP